MEHFSDILMRRLDSIGPTSSVEREALQMLTGQTRAFERGQDLVREGDKPEECMLVLSGFVCSYKVLPDSSKQIVSFHVPGDIPDLHSMFVEELDFSVAATTQSTVVVISHENLRRVLKSVPELVDLFWRDTLISAAVFRTWVMAAGRLTATEHLAHIFCELSARYQAVGLSDGNTYDFPVTQQELSDALGLTPVHVNRTLQELRGKDLIEMRSGKVNILDYDRLKALANFNPNYLHIRKPIAA